MITVDPEKYLSKFFQLVEKAKSRALLLDYDGTLAPFKTERDKARPYPGAPRVLEKIIRNKGTRLVVISGRRLTDLVPLLGLKQPPEIWGSHGGERLLADGRYEIAAISEDITRNLQGAAAWLTKMGWKDHVERKPMSLALHWRGMQPQEVDKMRADVMQCLLEMLKSKILTLHEFDGGLELRPPEITKKAAVNRILAEMAAGTVAAYLGDDLTDEDAFEAIKGRGLGILVRKEFRETKASLWLRPPDELLGFLKRWDAAARTIHH